MDRGNVAAWTPADYERAAQEYLESLPLEHFMEGTPHSTARKVAWVSLELLAAMRPGVQVANELLVQYPLNGDLGQVVPDNLVLLGTQPLPAMGSFNVPFERDYTIFWALEYVSESNKRKDYVDNFRRYGQELKVPYYLLFDPETRDLRLHRHNGTGYDRVAPGGHGRLAVPELEVEVGVLGGWARFWYRGELLPLPAELLAQMAALEARVEEAEARARREHQRADEEHRRAEQERQQAEKERQQAEEQRRRADQERQQAEEQRRRAEEAGRREEEQREQAEQQRRQTEAERQRADLAEAELQRLRSLLAQLQGGAGPTQPAP